MVNCKEERGTRGVKRKFKRRIKEDLPIFEKKKMYVRRIHTNGEIVTDVKINQVNIEAVVDTAADISIISSKTFEKYWKDVGYNSKVMVLNAAGEGQTFRAKQSNIVDVEIGGRTISQPIWVAPINDGMLLGLDILKKMKATIDTSTGEVKCKARLVTKKKTKKKGGVKTRAGTYLTETVVVPPESWMVCPGWLDVEGEGLWALEASKNIKVAVPHTLYRKGGQQSISLLNPGKEKVCLKKGSYVGRLVRVEEGGVSSERKKETAVRKASQGNRKSEDLPERLRPLWEGTSPDMDEETRTQLFDLLLEYEDIFATGEFDLGNFNAVKHEIDTGNAHPIKLGLRRTPVHFVKEEDALLEDMLRAGVIRPSASSWAAAPVLVRRKDGKIRWCLDYRQLNACTRKDVYPLPLMTECTDSLDQNVWFSKLDANSAYWQIPVEEKSKEKTAFRTRQGLFEFNRLPFGLCNSPSTFSRAMGLVLQGLSWKTVLAFLDDLCVLGRSAKEHLENLEEVFKRFRQFGLKLKPKKCQLFCKEVEFLGRKIGTNGVAMADHSIDTIKEWKKPGSIKEVESFLGLANFHRIFIRDFAKIAEPLSRLLKKKKWTWTQEQDEAFDMLKDRLLSAPVLAIPELEGEFLLDCDASGTAVAGELLQIQNGVEKVVAYGSFALTALQKTYCTTRKELLAIVRLTNHFRHYLLGRQFKVRTDHRSLKWLMNFRHAEGQLARWLEELGRFHMEVVFRPGKEHTNADALSRRPRERECLNLLGAVSLRDLPCGGCKYCAKAENGWKEFEKLVDDVKELASKEQTLEDENRHPNEGVTLGVRKVCLPESEIQWEAKTISIRRLTRKTKGISNRGGPTPPEQLSAAVQPEGSTNQAALHSSVMGDWKGEQEKDEDLRFLRKWLEDKKEPAEGDLMLANEAAKFYWVNRNMFFIMDGIIFFKHEHDLEVVVVPETMREDVLHACHGAASAGHPGRKRTQERVSSTYFWFRMSRDIRRFVEECIPCARNSLEGRKARFPCVGNQAGLPMEKVHMDFVGPLPRTPDGNEFILVMLDSFTRWIECIPLACQTAEATAQAAVNELFSRMGYATQVVSDQGRNFESLLFSELCRIVEIRKSRTTSYRPSANGQVERANKVLGKALRCLVGKKQNDWDKYVPLIAAVMRASVNRMTGFSPNMMMLGREVRLPTGLWLPAGPQETKSPVEHVEQLQTRMQEVHEMARNNLKCNLKVTKRRYDVKARVNKYEAGDPVWCLNKAPKNKLCARWTGPGVIRRKMSPYLFIVLLNNREEKTMHHDHLKSCKGKLPSWIQKEIIRIKKGEKILFCICRGVDDGSPMVQCDNCQEWFHCFCVGLKLGKAKA